VKDGLTVPRTGTTIDEMTAPAGVLLEMYKKMNEAAYDDLTLSMDIDKPGGWIAFNLIKRTKTVDYENGNARTAWLNLHHRYEPKTTTSKMKLQREFHSMACKTREDPELFILRLEEARISLDEVQKEDSEKITEQGQFLLHLLHSLPEEYESTVAQLLYEMKKDEEDNTSKIDLKAIMDALPEKFEKTKEKRWRNKNEDDETALVP
jgi:hypothetical protein